MQQPTAVVVACHGGRPVGWQRIGPWYPPVWWNQLLITVLRPRLRRHGIVIAPVVHTVRGWNAPELPALDDARRTIAAVRRRWPGVPLVLLGYSMGGRVVGRIAAESGAVGAVALTPWWPGPQDGNGLYGVPTVIVQGTVDPFTPPSDSLAVARRLQDAGTPVVRHVVIGGEHLMVVRRLTWQRLAGNAVLGLLGVEPYAGRLVADRSSPDAVHRPC